MGLLGATYNDKFKKESNFQREMLQNEQDFTERMWNQTNDWNLSQWERENEYNSPQAQMQRFLDAGINPNEAAAAIAGNDSASGSAMASAPSSPSPPSAPSPVGNNIFGNALGLADTVMGVAKYIDTERKNINANTQNTEEDTKKKQEETNKLKEEVRDLVYKNDVLNYETRREIVSRYEKNMADKQLSMEQREEVKEKVKVLTKQIEEIDSKIQINNQQIAESKKRIELLKEQIKTEQTVQGKNQAETALANEQNRLVQLQQNGQDLQNEHQDQINNFEDYLQGMGTSTSDNRNAVDKGFHNATTGEAYPKSKERGNSAPRRTRYRSQNHRNP